MHEYYTPISNKMQGFLVIFTIFVDYDHFYVNMIMSTKTTILCENIQNLFKIRRYWACAKSCLLNIDFAICLAKLFARVKITYLYGNFVQLNDKTFSSS